MGVAMSPSNAALATSAATEPIGTMSTAPDREQVADLEGGLPSVGLRESNSAVFPPNWRAQAMSSACAASMEGASAASHCACGIALGASGDLPDDVGPSTSMMRCPGRPRFPE